MKRPALSMIAAVARNGAIGRANALLWSNPEDQRHFRRVTMGWPVIMGRKTWDSLPARYRPLPGRRNIVISHDPGWRSEGAELAGSLAAAVERVAGTAKAYVIGGAQIYAQALPLADKLVLTEIDIEPPADAYFPHWDRADFAENAREPHVGADGIGYDFVTYTRLRGN